MHLVAQRSPGSYGGGVTLRFKRGAARFLLPVALAAALPLLPGHGVAAGSSGSWAIVPSFNAGSQDDEQLQGVSCVNADWCVAAGFTTSTVAPSSALALMYRGDSWNVSPAANPSGADNYLNDVSCPAVADCWAVGSTTADSAAASAVLLEQYDGRSWSVVASSGSGAPGDVLQSVDCVSATDCWAVGYRIASQLPQGLAMHYDGSAWQLAAVPSTGAGDVDYLNGVTCVNTALCFAVGSRYNPGAQDPSSQTLIEQWNGTAWSVMSAPTADNELLQGVTCTGATDCLAVGNDGAQPVALHFDGSAWTATAPVTRANGPVSTFNDVACAAAGDCWAVGSVPGSVNNNQTLAEHWNGSSWTLSATQNTSPNDSNALYDIACVDSETCYAAGGGSGPYERTLVEPYTGPAPFVTTITPSAGPSGGGQQVTVIGGNFAPGSSVTIDGQPVTPISMTGTTITFDTPAHAAGHVYVQVSDAAGSSTLQHGAGYVYTAPANYQPLQPYRAFDSRAASCIECTTSFSALQNQTITLAGGSDAETSGVPTSAQAVVLNVTAVNGNAPSFLTVYPSGTGLPVASNLNFPASRVVANLVTVALGSAYAGDPAREVTIHNLSGTVDVVVDVEGYYTTTPAAANAGTFHSMPPLHRTSATHSLRRANRWCTELHAAWT
jgi:hypothetical protein